MSRHKKNEEIIELEKVEETDEVVSDIKNIEDLPGVGEKTAEKLKEAGFNDIMSLAVTPSSLICEAADIGSTTANKIISAARKTLRYQ